MASSSAARRNHQRHMHHRNNVLFHEESEDSRVKFSYRSWKDWREKGFLQLKPSRLPKPSNTLFPKKATLQRMKSRIFFSSDESERRSEGRQRNNNSSGWFVKPKTPKSREERRRKGKGGKRQVQQNDDRPQQDGTKVLPKWFVKQKTPEPYKSLLPRKSMLTRAIMGVSSLTMKTVDTEDVTSGSEKSSNHSSKPSRAAKKRIEKSSNHSSKSSSSAKPNNITTDDNPRLFLTKAVSNSNLKSLEMKEEEEANEEESERKSEWHMKNETSWRHTNHMMDDDDDDFWMKDSNELYRKEIERIHERLDNMMLNTTMQRPTVSTS